MAAIGKLTVFFEEPFWVDVYEFYSEGTLEVCRVVFGAEPKDYEVYAYFLDNWNHLRFGPPLETRTPEKQGGNPKRAQRQIAKLLSRRGVATKAQQALNLMREQTQQVRKASNRDKKREQALKRLELHRQKKKEKHKGH